VKVHLVDGQAVNARLRAGQTGERFQSALPHPLVERWRTLDDFANLVEAAVRPVIG
jgi:hypothetical protein